MALVDLIVAALIRRDGRILLVNECGPGDPRATWTLPGGRVEAGEPVVEALHRELHEETGLTLSGNPRLAFALHVLRSDNSYLALTFACEADGDLAPSDPDGFVFEAAWTAEADALAALDGADWYDTSPLRSYLAAGGVALGEVAVEDRR